MLAPTTLVALCYSLRGVCVNNNEMCIRVLLGEWTASTNFDYKRVKIHIRYSLNFNDTEIAHIPEKYWKEDPFGTPVHCCLYLGQDLDHATYQCNW